MGNVLVDTAHTHERASRHAAARAERAGADQGPAADQVRRRRRQQTRADPWPTTAPTTSQATPETRSLPATKNDELMTLTLRSRRETVVNRPRSAGIRRSGRPGELEVANASPRPTHHPSARKHEETHEAQGSVIRSGVSQQRGSSAG
jgi:hypothetical protein